MDFAARFAAMADGAAAAVHNGSAAGRIVLACEHASNTIPAAFDSLGLPPDVLQTHIAWDPGALALAKHLSDRLDAALVHQQFSRLIYDCNRPPEAPSAMPVRSEIYDIPGNADLSEAEKFWRTSRLYVPFHTRLAGQIDRVRANGQEPVLVTIHSFTPVYHGQPRQVQVGILHDADSRLADGMLTAAAGEEAYVIARNQPYAPTDGVTHTLRLHALPGGIPNVMIEVRNDLIADADGQTRMADCLARLLTAGLADLT